MPRSNARCRNRSRVLVGCNRPSRRRSRQPWASYGLESRMASSPPTRIIRPSEREQTGLKYGAATGELRFAAIPCPTGTRENWIIGEPVRLGWLV